MMCSTNKADPASASDQVRTSVVLPPPNRSQRSTRPGLPSGCELATFTGVLQSSNQPSRNNASDTIWSSGVLSGKTSGRVLSASRPIDHEAGNTRRGSPGRNRCRIHLWATHSSGAGCS